MVKANTKSFVNGVTKEDPTRTRTAPADAATGAAARQAQEKAKAPEKTAAQTGTAKSTAARRATYIGNGGTKETGEVKVTPGTTPDYYNQMERFYQRAYADEVAANNAALEAARAQARAETQSQIDALGASYAGTNRQLYRDYMASRRTLPQQLAAQGYGGGLTESGMLRLQNDYGEALNENERARHAQEASYNQALSRQLFEAQTKTDEANRLAAQNRSSYVAALRQAAYKDAQQRAAVMAASGSFAEYGRLGFSPSEIRYLREMWKRMNPDLA